MIAFPFDNSYARELPDFCVSWQPERVPQPVLVFLNHALAAELGLDLAAAPREELAALFAGNQLPAGAQPIAQAYAGHQFGHFSPQLGDGRALLLGEVIDRHGRRRDIAFKGSGPTPFSRRGDGKAALGPMLREALVGEAMHALGIPTTRALAVVATGEPVYRERILPGAVLTRVAASHIRVGTFQYFWAHGTPEHVRRLADYAICRHYPELAAREDRYLALLTAVAERQAALIAQWMHVGFIHGVMNTDNMAISGETIDYGPCAFMEAYDPQAVFSSIDHGGRYAYQAQPSIARWNLARFAETLLPLISDDEGQAVARANEVIDSFVARYEQHWRAGLRAKLGLASDAPGDRLLGERWLDLLEAQRVDYTLAFRYLADAAQGDDSRLRTLFAGQPALKQWLEHWHARCAAEDAGRNAIQAARERAARMRRMNPWIIPRNHRVEEALAAAEKGDLGPFERLLQAVRHPFDENPAYAHCAEPAPAEFMSHFRTFCGT
ncbi:protein adenylyltransferase SelO [Thiobacter aerophilum]|uniref:Protein nucleotidyltransferase YdiU n=1 Tax=Thiobacter aerophilum TaxID=3121275 RepID=A0ABV0EJ09_9BURK